MKKHVFYRVYPGFYVRDDRAYFIRRVETTPQRFVWNVFDSGEICIATLRTLKAAMYAFSV